MTIQPTVWLNTFQKQHNDAYVFRLAFPAVFDYRQFAQLENNTNKTDKERELFFNERDKLIEVNDMYMGNKPFPENIVPTRMYSSQAIVKKSIKLPPVFAIINGYILLSEEFYTILKQFNLENNQIFPVDFYDLVLDEPVNNQTYYLLNVCQPQQYFLPEQSNQERLEPHKYTDPAKGHEVYYRPYNEEEGLCYVFSFDAIQSPVDIWYDPLVLDAVFMSDKLVSALKSANLGGDLSLLPCHLSTQS